MEKKVTHRGRSNLIVILAPQNPVASLVSLRERAARRATWQRASHAMRALDDAIK
jgi:hypothetical protein